MKREDGRQPQTASRFFLCSGELARGFLASPVYTYGCVVAGSDFTSAGSIQLKRS
jgi:hypothetical protein